MPISCREGFSMRRQTPLLFAALVLTAVVISPRARAVELTRQDGTTKTIWDGIYTEEQARRGEQVFKTECSYCHRDDLAGGFLDDGVGRAPALAGPRAFGSSLVDRWKDLTLTDMVASIAATMPQPKPASLTLQAYVDLVGYLFSKNGLPAGSLELPPDADALGRLLITEKQ
jgi:mono/diheme cytochrome c family protein